MPGELSAFGNMLKQYRQRAGFTQEELAARAGLSAKGISDLERGARRLPRQETVQLLAQALHLEEPERLRLEASVRQQRSRSQLTASPAQLSSSTPHPFVGRERELRYIDALLTAPDTTALFLMGEPGIGKSRLLQAAQQQAAHMHVLAMRCHRRSAQDPFAPLIDAITTYLSGCSPADTRQALVGCDWLARLMPLPDASQTASALAASLSSDQERRLLFRAIQRFLANIAKERDILLLCDDLHWAGPDLIDVVAFILQTATLRPIHLLGAYRNTEPASPSPLMLFIADLVGAGRAVEHQLTPLDGEQMAELLTTLLPDSTLTHQTLIIRRTAGNPLFLRCYAEEMQAYPQHGAQLEHIPTTITHTIRQRLLVLDEAAQVLLHCAAATDGILPRQVLRGLCQRLLPPSSHFVALLEELCRTQLLVESGADAYMFTHDLVREIIWNDVSTARKAEYHHALADTLVEQPQPLSSASIAHHYWQAGDIAAAMPWLERAGDAAAASYAFQDAVAHFARLLEALQRQECDEEWARIAEKQGAMLFALTRYAPALEIVKRAQVIYARLGNVAGVIRCLATGGRIHAMRGTSLAGLAELREYAPPANISAIDQAHLAFTLSALCNNSGRYDEALTAIDAAWHAITTIDNVALKLQAQIQRARTYFLLGRMLEARAIFLTLRQEAEAQGDVASLGMILLNLSLMSQEDGHLEESCDFGKAGLAAAQPLNNPIMLAQIQTSIAWSLFHLGAWQESLRQARAAVKLMRQLDMLPWAAPYPIMVLGAMLLTQGQPTEGVAALEEAGLLAARSHDLDALRSINGHLAEWEIVNGRATHALERLAPLVHGGEPLERDVVSLLPLLGWALLELDRLPEAEAILRQAVTLAQAQQLQLMLIEGLRVQALLHARNSQWFAAETAFHDALALCRSSKALTLTLKVWRAGGAVARYRGDFPVASHWLMQADHLEQQLQQGLLTATATAALFESLQDESLYTHSLFSSLN